MRFAIVGCGYVADYYVRTLATHADLELVGVFDRNPERSASFAKTHAGPRLYSALQEVVGDLSIELVANLTNPANHFAVSKAALEAGKHVYSEKPLALSFSEAEQLVELAESRGLFLACAPCNVLSETAQTLWKGLRDGCIGTPRLAYAELDDPCLFLNYRSWVSKSGAPWPFKDELYETGCTLEHAGYYLGWLTAFFGPAKRIVSFANVLCEPKEALGDHLAPQITVGCIEFVSGPVARITCGAYAFHDRSLRIFGDTGMLSVSDCWNYGAPVYLDRRTPTSWRERHPRRARLLGLKRPSLPLVRPSTLAFHEGNNMDFLRGIAELADAAAEKRTPRLSAQWSLHVNELALLLSEGDGTSREIKTTFEPMTPMPWAV
jgi:predicted dehydrogenase